MVVKEVTVLAAHARRDDPVMLDTFFAPLPYPDLRAQVAEHTNGRCLRYSDECSTMHVILLSSEFIACYTVQGITPRQAAEITGAYRNRW